MLPVLVLYATCEGHTARIASHIGACLERKGLPVVLTQVGDALPALEGFCGVIVGASVHYGRHPAALGSQLRAHSAALAARPGAFFSVCLTGKDNYREKFLRRCGWQPQERATFTGALQYSKYGPLKRWVVKGFAWMGGHDTDASHDYDYTDWKAVERFATAFAGRLV